MRPLSDAAKLSPERLARRMFSYLVMAVCTVIVAVSLLMSTTSGPAPTAHSKSRIGEVDPRAPRDR
jgi:hypothetical protein